MQIHELIVPKKQRSKRIGRGGTRGTYSGRGVKGQGARTGSRIDPLFEGGRRTLVESLKKVRGFKSIHPKKIVVQVSSLEQYYADGEIVSSESLIAKGLVKESLAKNGIKILSHGALTKKLMIAQGVLLSEKALAIVKDAGGSILE